MKQLTWLIHTKPDIFADASTLAQVTKNTFKLDHVEKFIIVVKYLKSTKNRTIIMNKLDIDSLHTRAYVDESLAKNYELKLYSFVHYTSVHHAAEGGH